MKTPDVVMLAGDWHGATRYAKQAIELAHRNGVKLIIQLGDFGVWPGETGNLFLKALRLDLEKYDIDLWVVPGNHEDYNQIEAIPVDPETGLQKLRNRIYLLPRGARWNWNGHDWMALGGATSLDRKHRKPHLSWWTQESITQGQAQSAIDGGHADVMVTHDAPAGIHIPGLLPDSMWDAQELHTAKQHQALLASVVHAVKPKKLFHGHFHIRYATDLFYDDQTTCRVTGLADNGDALFRNVFFIDTHTLEPWQENEAEK